MARTQEAVEKQPLPGHASLLVPCSPPLQRGIIVSCCIPGSVGRSFSKQPGRLEEHVISHRLCHWRALPGSAHAAKRMRYIDNPPGESSCWRVLSSKGRVRARSRCCRMMPPCLRSMAQARAAEVDEQRQVLRQEQASLVHKRGRPAETQRPLSDQTARSSKVSYAPLFEPSYFVMPGRGQQNLGSGRSASAFVMTT